MPALIFTVQKLGDCHVDPRRFPDGAVVYRNGECLGLWPIELVRVDDCLLRNPYAGSPDGDNVPELLRVLAIRPAGPADEPAPPNP